MPFIPEEQYAIRQQSREWRRRAGSIYVKAALVIYGAILMLLFILYRDAQHSVWQGFLNFFIVVLFFMATIGLFVKNPLGGEHDPRPIDLGRMERRGLEKLIGDPVASPEVDAPLPADISPPGQRINDLSELPSELASNPEFQKLFHDAQALGGSVRISSSRQRLGLGGLGPAYSPASAKKIQQISKVVYTIGLLLIFAILGLTFVAAKVHH